MTAATATTFDQVYRDHQGGVRRYLSRRCGDGMSFELDDAVQETFLQAWRLWRRRTSDNVRAWLLGIARRVFSHMLRAASLRTESREIEWIEFRDDRAVQPTQELAAYIMQLRDRFGCLGPVQAEVLAAVADGAVPEEIATQRGQSAASVRMALSLGRRRLREMEGNGDDRPQL